MNSCALASSAADTISLAVGAADAIRDVLADRAREQRRILQHGRHPAAEPRRVELAHVAAADADAPFVRIVEAQQQVQHRRLAGSRLADERDDLAGRDPEIDPFERLHFGTGGIAEAHAFERDRRLELLRPIAAIERNLRRRADELEDPVRGADRAHRLGHEPGGVAKPARDQQRVEDERDERAGREAAADNQVPADPDGEHRRAFAGDERDRRRAPPRMTIFRRANSSARAVCRS